MFRIGDKSGWFDSVYPTRGLSHRSWFCIDCEDDISSFVCLRESVYLRFDVFVFFVN